MEIVLKIAKCRLNIGVTNIELETVLEYTQKALDPCAENLGKCVENCT